jgi:hypothetical protein
MSNGITQGVWRKGERVSYGGNAHGFPIYFNDDGEQVVDYVYTEADADLICAAPDLLDALEMIVAEADSYTARTGKPVYNWLDQARAAIAKARGTPC